MRTKEFGGTGVVVSEIGFGGSRIGGMLAQGSGSREALGVLSGALDAGITFYDTADMYAQGESEALIGKAFRDRRDRVFLATKGGFCLPARRKLVARVKPLVRPIARALGITRAKLPAGAPGALAQDFSPAYLTQALEASLRRLRTDHVDLYQLHSPPPSLLQDGGGALGEALETLEALQGQGKLRFYGIATEAPEDAALCLRLSPPGIASLQVGFGLLDLDALDDGTLADAKVRGLAVIARGCFGAGLLKDGPGEEELKAITPKWPRILGLRAESARLGRPLLESALQFCAGTPGVSVTLLGMRTREHLRGNLRHCAARPLSPEEYAALRLRAAGG